MDLKPPLKYRYIRLPHPSLSKMVEAELKDHRLKSSFEQAALLPPKYNYEIKHIREGGQKYAIFKTPEDLTAFLLQWG